MSENLSFHDHFSGHAQAYAQARPHYPDALFGWLARQAPWHDLALDVGCGNGQAAVALARYFEAVHATDPSANQISNALRHPRVSYRVEPAEQIAERDRSVALLCVAQALHWFDFARFFPEALRVMQGDALFAALSYGLLRINPELDTLIQDFELGLVGPFWPPERRHVDAQYTTIEFPFERIETPEFLMQHDWNASQLFAYLETWSAVQRYRKAEHKDPLAALAPALLQAWGDPQTVRTVQWPLLVWAGRKG